jgi:hypothetical protein
LQSQLTSLQGGSSTTTTTTGTSYTFTRNLTVGDTGEDVKMLQKALNADGVNIAVTGAGSPGNETSYFGSITKAGVVRFQNKYASEILAPVGLINGTGYVGASTRAKLNSMGGATTTTTDTTTTTTTTTTPVGTGLMVSSAVQQPATMLAPTNAARIPFTKVTLTASADGDITVNSLTVERTGLAQDAAFSGVVLLDEDGTQLGIAKTFNSLHQATIGEAFTVKAGTSKTVTVAGNIGTISTTYNGQIATIAVVGVNTSATVSGSLPITGTGHTMNGTLTIGDITPAVGVVDPGASADKEIGTTGYTFSAVKFTAGSSEKVRMHSIRWNQSGSASKDDLANVKVYVDGTAYTPTVSADGKYYTATFGSGIVIDKGLSKEISIRGDIENGSGRTVIFDLYKTTDLYATGETYGYGITASVGSGSASDSDSDFTATTPWFDGAAVTIADGSVSSISKSNTVAAQNISVLSANQPLGGFEVEVKGEAVSIQQMIFNVLALGDEAENITNISLVDQNGSVVAGPVDGASTATDSAHGTITFTDTVTLPVGKTVLTLKGQLSSAFVTNDTVTASTTPGGDNGQWTTVTGQTTGNTISLSSFNTAVTGNTMTVKSGAVTVTPSASPVSQNVVMGQTGFTFANFQFDATASGEDVRFNSAQFYYTDGGSDPTNCYVYDGSTKLNNTAVQPATSGADTYTFDTALIVPKGTVKTITLKCDVPASLTADDQIIFGVLTADTISGTGVQSGQTVATTHTTANSGTMTLKASGTVSVSLDSSSPSYTIAAGGSTDVTAGILKFTGTNEAITMSRVALQLTSTASSSASDIVKVSLYDGATKVGEALFTGSNTTATSTLTGTFEIPKDGTKTMTIKVDLAEIGNAKVGTEGALIAIDYDDTDPTGTRGIGVSSGTTIDRTSSADTAASGVRMFRSFPTFTKMSVPTNVLSNGEKSLLRFRVTADSAGDVGVMKFTLRMATTTASVTGLNIYAYTDSGFSNPVSGLSSDGGMMATAILAASNNTWTSSASDLEIYAQTTAAATTTIQVPAGTSRYFDVRGTIAGAASGASVSTQLQGDAAYHSMANPADPSATSPLMLAASGNGVMINEDVNDDFIWSPNATTTSGLTANDWTNGYGVSGLPSSNMTSEVLSQ